MLPRGPPQITLRNPRPQARSWATLGGMGFLDSQLGPLRAPDLDDEMWLIVERYLPEAHELLGRIVDRYELLNAEPADELPDNLPNVAISALDGTVRALASVQQTRATDPNIHSHCQTLAQNMATAWSAWRNNCRQWIRSADALAMAAGADLQEQLLAARAAREEAERITDGLRVLSATAGSVELAHHYDKYAQDRRANARHALWAVVGLSFGLVVGGTSSCAAFRRPPSGRSSFEIRLRERSPSVHFPTEWCSRRDYSARTRILRRYMSRRRMLSRHSTCSSVQPRTLTPVG